MAITVNNNCINFGNYSLIVCTDGFGVNGKLYSVGQSPFPPSVVGTTTGFIMGSCLGPGLTRCIESFPFASDTNTSGVGNMVTATSCSGGANSDTAGFQLGGFATPVSSSGENTIQGFCFATCSSCFDVGDLTQQKRVTVGGSSKECGFAASGCTGPGYQTRIDAFVFSSSSNASCIGDVINARKDHAGHSSSTHGYISGGEPITPARNIEKYAFASGSSICIGQLLAGVQQSPAGLNSETHGYNAGGDTPAEPVSTVIQKWPFASDTNAADVGNLSLGRRVPGGGNSSTDNGYVAGGTSGGCSTYDKFPFASDTNATCIGNLTGNRTWNTNPNAND